MSRIDTLSVGNSKIVAHHHSEQHVYGEEKIHVYAIAGQQSFGSSSGSELTIIAQTPLWGVIFGIQGTIDKISHKIDAALSVHIPIFGMFPLADVKGDLNDGGVKTGFGASMLNGEARFFMVEKWVCLDLSAKVYDTDHNSVIVRLIELQD
ncbi:hypothetical protein C8Q76DRAFT_220736 [Earliella scabrosa]|nr:hypothetical protein C8Q76DRAFT_220736 [Earliella scabrosa]